MRADELPTTDEITLGDSGCMISWSGRDRRGNARAGQVAVPDVAAFVQNKFDTGWRVLRVDADHRVVGRIEPSRSDRSRTWWAEGAESRAEAVETAEAIDRSTA